MNTSSGNFDPAAYARISSTDSSRGTTTRDRPSAESSSDASGDDAVICVDA
jgi:hypothetical protein